MYKQIIICVIIVILIVGLDYYTQNYTKESVKEVTDSLYSLKDITEKQDSKEKENKEQITKMTNDIISKWDTRYESLSYYIEHNELEKVKIEFASLESDINTEEYSQACSDINRAIYILEHIKQKTSLEIKNIF